MDTNKYLNSESVLLALTAYHQCLDSIDDVTQKIEALATDLTTQKRRLETELGALKEIVRQKVEEHGNYFKDDEGWEARLEPRRSINYRADTFRKLYPEFAAAVIVETVDMAKVKGLLKGGLVSEEKLEPAADVKTTTAFIIR